MEPFSIHLINREKIIEKSFFVVGDVPKNIRAELEKISNGAAYNSQLIKSHFGSNFEKYLSGNPIKGGDDEIEITMDDLDFIEEEPVKPGIKADNKVLHFFYINFYPEDNLMEFRQKVAYITGIPIFRQHIWFEENGKVFPIYYNLFANDIMLYPNIHSAESGDDKILDVPIKIKYYNIRSALQVQCLETFTLMKKLIVAGIRKFYIMDLNSFFPKKELAYRELSNDANQLEILYYGFIILYYPILTPQILLDYLNGDMDNYPSISPKKSIIEKKISLGEEIKKYEDTGDKIRKKTTSGITYISLNIFPYGASKEAAIFIRNLFDLFPLDNIICASKCNLTYGGKSYIIHKVFAENELIKEKVVNNSICFKIKFNIESSGYILLTIFRNGNYSISSKWHEEDHLGYEEIFGLVSKTIDGILMTINKFDNKVLHENKKLLKMTRQNTRCAETNFSIFYKTSIDANMFSILGDLINMFAKAGILHIKEIERTYIEFYFAKGIHQFNITQIDNIIQMNNKYEYLTNGIYHQKWSNIYEKVRLTKITYRQSDIKVDITCVKDEEYEIFYSYIMILFNMFSHKCKTGRIEPDNVKKSGKKKLSMLKEQDPLLYDFKKIYNSDVVYSKICQKPYQPLMITEAEYENLPKEKKAKAVKYRNFTTGAPQWYVCPNPKYPYIKFIIKQHPKDFGIPCCKKTDVSKDPKDPKRIIHNIILKEGIYAGEKKTITEKSQYIMRYGKDIEVGRLTKLPEDTLELIFHETSVSSADIECNVPVGYYLFGVPQSVGVVNNCGFVHILAQSLNMTIPTLVSKIIEFVRVNADKFFILLNGHINMYFYDVGHLMEILYLLFVDEKASNFVDIDVDAIRWNSLFMNFAFLYFKINIIYFVDELNNGSIDIRLPNKMYSPNDFLIEKYQNLIVLQKGKKMYPIYYINTDLFFKARMIETKLFGNNNDIIQILYDIILKTFSNMGIRLISLETLYVFFAYPTMSNKIKPITKLINNNNYCYAVLIEYNRKMVYVPIVESYYKISTMTNYEPFMRNELVLGYKTLFEYINEYNEWSNFQLINQNVKYKLIEPLKWLRLQSSILPSDNDKIIGMVDDNDLYYYFNDVSIGEIQKFRKMELLNVYYDPNDINKHIYKKTAPVNNFQNVGNGYYKYALYQLMLLEFLNEFNSQRNEPIREKLKKMALKATPNNMESLYNEINDIVKDADDNTKIKTFFNDFILIQKNKKNLIDIIDANNFNFDKGMYNKLKGMKKDELIIALKKIAKKIIKIGTPPKDISFGNIMSICALNVGTHCHGDKLIIEEKRLNQYLDILASDILNPLKEKWIFSSLMVSRVINYFRFHRRGLETIYIEH